MSFPNEIQTERLLLRWPVEPDAEEIFSRYASDPEVTRYLSWRPHRSIDDTLAFRRQTSEWREAGKSFAWLMRSRETNLVVGMISLRIDGPRAHLGYCLARDAWGHGYATEAARQIIVVALAESTVWRVEAFCDL